MPYDPDLDPILDAIHARLDRLEAASQTVPAPVPPAPEMPNVPIWRQVSQTVLSIPAEVRVPAGQREIYIPVTADHTRRQSFYCYVPMLRNVTGGGINVGTAAQSRDNFGGMDVLYRWSPGDDPTHYVKLTTKTAYAAGQSFEVEVRVKGLGDGQKGRFVRVVFDAAATHPAMPAQHHRPLRRLDLSAARRKNTFAPASVRWSPSGFDASGAPIWRSQVAHGRTQDGNQETGLYADETIPGAETPISYDASERAVRLHTRAFTDANRLEWNNRLFRQQAVMLNGQTMDAVCGVEGVWRMEAKIPIRRYSWPAFWLVGRSATTKAGSWAMWPPEIDILEKFNHAWGSADTPYTTTFAQHYGPAGKPEEKAGSFGSEIELDQWAGETLPLDQEYHSWACAVSYNADPFKSEVTFFVDDVEVGCHVLHARHQDLNTKVEFFPMANVAVKAPSTYSATRYNTDDGRGNTGDMLVRDIAFYPSGWRFA